jgi:DNA adenine methylase
LLAKEPSKVEVINDINADLVNFYRCVRFHPDELIKEIQWVLTSRKELIDLKAQRGLTDIQRAASWFLIQCMSFAGDGSSYGVSREPGATSRSRSQEAARRVDDIDGTWLLMMNDANEVQEVFGDCRIKRLTG